MSPRSVSPGFLTGEWYVRLERGPVWFDLRAQLAGPPDSIVDPSAPRHDTQVVAVRTLEGTGIDRSA